MTALIVRTDHTQLLPGRTRARPRPARCAICGGNTKLLHFCLLLPLVADAKTNTTRGAGAIDLCEPCWRTATNAGRIRRRPARV